MVVLATKRSHFFPDTSHSALQVATSNRLHRRKYRGNMRHQVPNLYAIKLNNHATTLLHDGSNEGAEKCLIRALLSCTMKEMPPPADLLTMEKGFHEQERQGKDLEYCASSFGNECKYDCIEGMRVYLEPFYIPMESKCVDETIIQKAVFFNLGICYIRIKQYDEAHAYFSKAMSLYTTQCRNIRVPPFVSKHHGHPLHAPTNVMILHNLGYINYIQKEYAEALSNQNEVLRILLKSNHHHHHEHISYCTEHVTACLNSIGIVTMHIISKDIDLSKESEALRVQHCFMEALAIQNEFTTRTHNNDNEDFRHGRSSLNHVRNTLGRIKEVGIELLQQEQQRRRKKIQHQCYFIKCQRRITV